MKVISALILGLGVRCCVAQTTLNIELSRDGVTWQKQLLGLPGDRVEIRYSVTYAGTQAVHGLSRLIFQPVIKGWQPDDQLVSWATTGTNSTGGAIVDQPGSLPVYGRIKPFGAISPGTDAYTAFVHPEQPRHPLRIARGSVTNWVGNGPVSGSESVNNFNGAGGIVCFQRPVGVVGESDPPYRSGSTGVVIARMAMVLGPSVDEWTREWTVPLEGIMRDSASGERVAAWYQAANPNGPVLVDRVSVEGAWVMLVPAPTSSVVLGCGVVVLGRRRGSRTVAAL